MAKSYKDFILWQKSMILVEFVYKITAQLPKDEIYGISSQIRRSAVSIPSNIAEGSKRGKKEYSQFLKIAYGLSAELETQLLIVQKIYKINYIQEILDLLTEIQKMLSTSVKKLNSQL